VRFAGLSVEKSGPPPLPGEHTETILAELGYSPAEIEELSRTGAIQMQARA
jgi:crotonobetainyl-CoA:carnitine CoA-transferase CaiB-like acyl-CoA transferase